MVITLTLGGEQFDAFRLNNLPLQEDLLQSFLIQSWRSVEEVQNLEMGEGGYRPPPTQQS